MKPLRHVLLFGLGALGLPIARRLIEAGFDVTGVDPRPEASAALRRLGGRVASPAAPAAAVEQVFAQAPADAGRWAILSCVTHAEALEALWFAPRGLATAPLAGCAVVDHTTTGIALARRLADQCAQQQADWTDAPLSGGTAGAEDGLLSAMLGGEVEAVRALQPLLAAYCTTTMHLGPAGAGQAGKLANQLAIAGTNLGLMAATRFAAEAGLHLPACLAALAGGSAQSAQLVQHRHKLVQQADAPQALFGWLHKDMVLARDAAGTMDADVQALVARIAAAYGAGD